MGYISFFAGALSKRLLGTASFEQIFVAAIAYHAFPLLA
jgi:hypothetical protein